MADAYVKTADYRSGNVHVTVMRPILTDEEREKRMGVIKQAAAKLLEKKYEIEAKAKMQKEA